MVVEKLATACEKEVVDGSFGEVDDGEEVW